MRNRRHTRADTLLPPVLLCTRPCPFLQHLQAFGVCQQCDNRRTERSSIIRRYQDTIRAVLHKCPSLTDILPHHC